jgi:hypothetical protein
MDFDRGGSKLAHCFVAASYPSTEVLEFGKLSVPLVPKDGPPCHRKVARARNPGNF